MHRLFRLCFLFAAATLVGCSSGPGATAGPERAQAGAPSSVTPEADAGQPAATLEQPATGTNPTVTPTPEPTAAPLNTPTPTADKIEPGSYDVHGCASTPGSTGQLTLCVESVTVLPNEHMRFMVNWELSGVPKGSTVMKPSDAGNERLYLVDEQGSTYPLIAVGGAAAQDTLLQAGKLVSGWFEFEAPGPGAHVFEFHDEEGQLVIKNLQVGAQMGDATAYRLVNYPMQLSYSEADWEQGQQADGGPALAHKNYAGCTIRDLPSREPQGSLKNELKLGDVTYRIYGYFDAQRNVWLREYVATRLAPGDESATDPLLLVQIPTKNSLGCILAASEVLATLAGP